MLNEDQKKYIFENFKHKSIRKIAKDLKIKRLDVKSVIQEIHKTQSVVSPSFSKRRKFFLSFLLLALLVFHLYLRYNTFWLSHMAGDQQQYVGLAMKLEKFGFGGYSLRKIDAIFVFS